VTTRNVDPLMPAAPEAALDVQGLTVAYMEGRALEQVDMRFAAGAMTAIVGPNGAGKSTLLKACLDLIPRSAGDVRVFGAPFAAMRGRVAYVPQRAGVDWDFPARALDVVLMGLYRETGALGRMTMALRRRAADALARVGMADFAKRQIGALSGGQQQRVFLARALAQGADLYLLDEPFAGVDAATEAAIVDVLHGLRTAGKTIVAVHHDLSTVPVYFDRVLMLNRRVIAEGPVATAFTPTTLAATYGTPLPTTAEA
jgi:manganese/zinc/iron transport system ATP- binding protein